MSLTPTVDELLLRVQDNWIEVGLLYSPKGLWTNGVVTEHPSYVPAAIEAYPELARILADENGDACVFVFRVPRIL